ncbi:hypothetical protein [Roseovarius confluentis]|uniref:hypothetical protein n=1 Tax=Roseovarius confluentis TaxID=1852027 RepID=UPI003C7ADD3B
MPPPAWFHILEWPVIARVTRMSFGVDHALMQNAMPFARPHHPPRRSSVRSRINDLSAFLQDPANWPTGTVPEFIETHASLVFMGGDTVLKLKKSIRIGALDLRSVASRHHSCEEEFRLNQELAGDMYRRTRPITRHVDGKLALDGRGTIVDWLLEMRRLPAAQMLDYRLLHGPAPSRKEIHRVCDVMAAFYLRSSPSSEFGTEYMARWQREASINACHLADQKSVIGEAYDPALPEMAISALENCRAEIMKRGALGLIVEGHGDLRPEHVNLGDPPIVFDRLEFDRGLRLADPYEELNYLGLGCSLLGTHWIRNALLHWLADSGLDRPSPALMNAYSLNRLLTRARLAIDHLLDRHIRTPEKWPRQARQCLSAARRFVHDTPSVWQAP